MTMRGIYPSSLEILLAGAVRQLDTRALRLVRKDGEPIKVADLLRLVEDLERVLNVDTAS